jgi:hypothetical protein
MVGSSLAGKYWTRVEVRDCNNTLAEYVMELIIDAKSFMIQAPRWL